MISLAIIVAGIALAAAGGIDGGAVDILGLTISAFGAAHGLSSIDQRYSLHD